MKKGSKGGGRNNYVTGSTTSGGLLPNSFKIISSCLKTVSTNASSVVRSAGASVASSVAATPDDRRDQVTWAGFDRLELSPASFRHVLLLGYQTGFQVVDVEDASDFTELVSKRDGPVTFLQMLPVPARFDGNEKFKPLHPLLLVVAGDEATRSGLVQNRSYLGTPGRNGSFLTQSGNPLNSPTAVRFYSLQSNCYVKVLRFRTTVLMVRCSPLIVAVGLEKEIRCIDAITLEDKFSVPTYPVPQFGGQGMIGVNIGYGPLAVGPRWLAYASSNLLVSNTGRLSPKKFTPSPGISPSTSPSNSTLVAHYAMESSKQLAAGLINLGDMGYKTLSKYCPELRQDRPSSPGSSNPTWKSRVESSDDNAGMVVVKEVISEAVISQFRAHASPISALCFDPSGTLLVTASIHGNNVNIFRIMPYTRNGSNNQSHDWSYSHVHLYKLYRGITTAIIQDICFGHYSQWISIISSKGTCHLYVLSPFGGDTNYRTYGFNDPANNPVLSLPWWSTPSFVVDQQPSPPPPPVTLSVVSRIKNNNSGFLNSVTKAATSAAGKAHMPSGAVAAVFHNSMTRNFQDVPAKGNSLEHLLVYTPSGYVIQHELLPSIGAQPIDVNSHMQSGSYLHIQEEESRLIFRSCQWWEVCRRSDSLERERSISSTTFDAREPVNINHNYGDDSVGDQKLVRADSPKRSERSHWYLSNAEVQINSGRLPVWQNSKVRFYAMNSPGVESYSGGEFEIEKIPFNEVEIRRKDLLPVFDHFNSIKSGWNDRAHSGGQYPSVSSSEPRQYREKAMDETIICHSKPASLSSTESSEGGSSHRMDNLLDLDPVNYEKSSLPINHTPNGFYRERRGISTLEHNLLNQKPLGTFLHEHYKPEDSHIRRNTAGISEAPLLTVDHFDSGGAVVKEASKPSKQVDFQQYFQESYCKVLEPEHDDHHYGREASDNDGEEDELLGGMFDLSEEG